MLRGQAIWGLGKSRRGRSAPSAAVCGSRPGPRAEAQLGWRPPSTPSSWPTSRHADPRPASSPAGHRVNPRSTPWRPEGSPPSGTACPSDKRPRRASAGEHALTAGGDRPQASLAARSHRVVDPRSRPAPCARPVTQRRGQRPVAAKSTPGGAQPRRAWRELELRVAAATVERDRVSPRATNASVPSSRRPSFDATIEKAAVGADQAPGVGRRSALLFEPLDSRLALAKRPASAAQARSTTPTRPLRRSTRRAERPVAIFLLCGAGRLSPGRTRSCRRPDGGNEGSQGDERKPDALFLMPGMASGWSRRLGICLGKAWSPQA